MNFYSRSSPPISSLPSASLLPEDIASRLRPLRENRAVGNPSPGPQPVGGNLYRRKIWSRLDGSHMVRGVARAWWHWPTITAAVTLVIVGLIVVLSDTVLGVNVSLMLRKLI